MRIFNWKSLRLLFTDIVVWVLAMVVFVFLRFYHGYELKEVVSAPEPLVNFQYTLWLGIQAGLILGLVYGVVDIFLDQHWLKKRSYGSVLLIKGVIHFVIILALSIMIRVEAFDIMDIELTLEELGASLANPGILIIFLYTTLVNFAINFTRQITLKFGPGNLTKFLTGRFHHPKEEDRIFMFLDMKDSTTHAEKLGHVKFASLIHDCFSDLTVVEKREAEVYQYIGDEVILYWEVKQGIKNLNCILAYYDFKQRLESRSNYYQNNYGLQPIFKAGANVGPVTVTEIGDIKRDLAFLGVTLNTCARIHGLCYQFQADLLISDFLYELLGTPASINLEFVDSLTPTGKQQRVGIYHVKAPEPTLP